MDPQSERQIHSIGIVVPFFNEEKVIQEFYKSLTTAISILPYQFFLYFIDDGSSDRTAALLEEIAGGDDRVTIIEFSRNFGHQAALSAGLDAARGDAVISLDGDGQHPPELIPELIRLYASNDEYDIIQTKREPGNETAVKRATSGFFYSLMNRFSNVKMIEGTADFRLMSRRSVDSLKQMPEYHRFLRGMIPWMGYKTIILPYRPSERLGGVSKYSLARMVKLAADAIFSFSLAPMRITIILGLLYLVLALAEILYVVSYFVTNKANLLTPGWPSLMFASLLGNAIILISLGVFGYYIGYIFQQIKNRPLYIIKSIKSRQADPPGPPEKPEPLA